MATNYYNVEMGVVDASGNLNVIYPVTTANNVAVGTNETLASRLNTINSNINKKQNTIDYTSTTKGVWGGNDKVGNVHITLPITPTRSVFVTTTAAGVLMVVKSGKLVAKMAFVENNFTAVPDYGIQYFSVSSDSLTSMTIGAGTSSYVSALKALTLCLII